MNPGTLSSKNEESLSASEDADAKEVKGQLHKLSSDNGVDA